MATENLKTGKMNFFGNLKNLWIACLFVGIFLMLSGNVSAYTVAGGGICICGDRTPPHPTDACRDCSAALNDNINCRNLVYYVGIVKINNYRGTCINNPANFNNKIFDCMGNTIDGVLDLDSRRQVGLGDRGIYIHTKNFNTIRNCIITDFWLGIFLDSSSNNALINNTINNSGYGVYFSSSSNNVLTNNTVNNNGGGGIWLSRSSNNILINNIVSGNGKKEHRVLGTGGIYLWRSNSNTLTNNIVNNNTQYGIYLNDARNNNIISNTVRFNGQHGFLTSATSTGNILRNNIFCDNNQTGGAFFDIQNNAGGTNTGSDNTCNTVFNYNDAGATGCTNECIVIDGCGVRIKYISNLKKVKNYATDVGCGPNALANVLDYHGLSPNTPSTVRDRYSNYFRCDNRGLACTITDENMVNILNSVKQNSSLRSLTLSWASCPSGTFWNHCAGACIRNVGWCPNSIGNFTTRFRTPLSCFKYCSGYSGATDITTACVWTGSLTRNSIYDEIDASRPVILLINNYHCVGNAKVYTTCGEEWKGDSQCKNPITPNSISGGHYVTVVGYTTDKKYLVVRPGYNYTTTPCAPKNGLVMIEVNALYDRDYPSAIIFKK